MFLVSEVALYRAVRNHLAVGLSPEKWLKQWPDSSLVCLNCAKCAQHGHSPSACDRMWVRTRYMNRFRPNIIASLSTSPRKCALFWLLSLDTLAELFGTGRRPKPAFTGTFEVALEMRPERAHNRIPKCPSTSVNV